MNPFLQINKVLFCKHFIYIHVIVYTTILILNDCKLTIYRITSSLLYIIYLPQRSIFIGIVITNSLSKKKRKNKNSKIT